MSRPRPRSRGGRLFACALIAVALAVLASASVLRADPPKRDYAPGAQWSPAVAGGPENVLAVWMDQRPVSSIAGTRVSRSGVVLDPNQIWISIAPGTRDVPDLAFDGQNYLVAWKDARISGFSEIYASRVTPSGDVLDSSGIPISTGGCCRSSPAVAHGQNYFVVWSHPTEATGIRGTRVDSGGTVLDPAGIPISEGPLFHWEPAVASNGTDFLVAWVQADLFTGQIKAARVAADGTVLDPSGIEITAIGHVNSPAVAWDGTNYFLVWQDGRAGNKDIYGARVSPEGTVLDPAGIPIATGNVSQAAPSVAFDGENYMVAWLDEPLRVARVSKDGLVLDPGGIPVSETQGGQLSPDISFGPENYLVVWGDGRNGWDIYGARVTTHGTVLDPGGFVVSTGPQPAPPPPPPPIEPPPPQWCIVPRVVGLRVSLALRKIQRARCTVGRVRWKRSARPGIVLSQKPRARSVRPYRFPVTLVVGRR